MTASLPMYDTEATRDANDRLWSLIRARLRDGPARLDRTTDPHETWEDPGLVLSQTCGLPYRSRLHDRVTLVGTPDYGISGCPPGYYCSVIVVREGDPRDDLGDFRDATLARNDVRSQSGWAAIEDYLSENKHDFSFSGHTLDTGGHLLSAKAVAAGRADLAALDAVTWALICRDDTVASQLRVLAKTRPTPGLPLISAPNNDAARIFESVQSAISALPEADRRCLLINSLVHIPKAQYLAEPLPPAS